MTKTSLVLGGNGALGKAMVSTFRNHGWKVLSMDIHHNAEASENVIVDPEAPMKEQAGGLVD